LPGLFDRTCQTIRRVAELHKQFPNFALLTSTIFSSQTQDHILDFIDWIQDNLPIDQSNVTFVRGNPCDTGTLDVHPDIYRKVLNRLRSRPVRSEHNGKMDSLLSYSMFLNTLNTVERANKNSGKRVFHCCGGTKFLVIGHQAEVLPCELLDETRSLGNLRDFDYDINALLASSPAKKNIHWVRGKHCACTWECAIQASKIFDPLQWAELGWRALRMKFVGSLERKISK
jgi:MoaA/NifB/PqqE/SkfB family radical SAM enzyme